MNTQQDSLQELLERFDQSHLLQFVKDLEQPARKSLQDQIQSLDFEQIRALSTLNEEGHHWSELARRAEPPSAIRLAEASQNRSHAIERGVTAIADGHLAMILVAGGQGTRLGFDHPKGMFAIGPVSGRTLFQVAIDKLRALGHKFGVNIPLLVMTSPATHRETSEFLERHNWFGLPPSHTRIFCQGVMPAVDRQTGKILLSAKGQIAVSPDGHGGMLSALQRSGCLDELRQWGVQHVFYCQIDNPMVQVCDPATLGFHLLEQSQMTAQAVPKRQPLQRVGNIVSIDGKTHIIEYSDLPDDVARQCDSSGDLKLWAGNIAVHVFELAFLHQMAEQANALPFHRAHKKVSFLDTMGDLVQPDAPNAIKFERFIFDLLPMADRTLVVEVDPADAFAPVKNAASEQTETAETARQAITAQARRWLEQAGVSVAPDALVEIDPMFAMDAAELAVKLPAGTQIENSTYLQ